MAEQNELRDDLAPLSGWQDCQCSTLYKLRGFVNPQEQGAAASLAPTAQHSAGQCQADGCVTDVGGNSSLGGRVVCREHAHAMVVGVSGVAQHYWCVQ